MGIYAAATYGVQKVSQRVRAQAKATGHKPSFLGG